MFVDRFVAFDHQAKKAWAVAVDTPASTGPTVASWRWLRSMKARMTSLITSSATAVATPEPKIVPADDPAVLAVLAQLQQRESSSSSVLHIPQTASADFSFRVSRDQYVNAISECLRNIINGESYELCLTTQVWCAAWRR